nr:hypothetical protein [Tanacetum cinerariifolium]
MAALQPAVEHRTAASPPAKADRDTKPRLAASTQVFSSDPLGVELGQVVVSGQVTLREFPDEYLRRAALEGVVHDVGVQGLLQGTGKVPVGVGAVTGADQADCDRIVCEQRVAAFPTGISRVGAALLQIVRLGQQVAEQRIQRQEVAVPVAQSHCPAAERPLRRPSESSECRCAGIPGPSLWHLAAASAGQGRGCRPDSLARGIADTGRCAAQPAYCRPRAPGTDASWPGRLPAPTAYPASSACRPLVLAEDDARTAFVEQLVIQRGPKVGAQTLDRKLLVVVGLHRLGPVTIEHCGFLRRSSELEVKERREAGRRKFKNRSNEHQQDQRAHQIARPVDGPVGRLNLRFGADDEAGLMNAARLVARYGLDQAWLGSGRTVGLSSLVRRLGRGTVAVEVTQAEEGEGDVRHNKRCNLQTGEACAVELRQAQIAEAEHRAVHASGNVQVFRAEDDPAHDHQQEGECPANYVESARCGVQTDRLFNRQPYTVPGAPDDVGDVGAVPQTAQQHGGQADVPATPELGDRLADPSGQADVPATPELGDRLADVRLLEVFHEAETHHQAQTDGHVAITGEVKVQLCGVRQCAQPGIARGGVLQCKAMVGDHGQRVGNENLLDEALHEPRAALGELVQERDTDRQQHMRQDERLKTNGRHHRVDAVDAKVGVLEVAEDAQVDSHTEQQPALCRFGSDPGGAYAQADPVVP